MLSGPTLLRRFGRRFSRRFVFLSALITVVALPPSAAGVEGDPTPPVITINYSQPFPANGWFRSTVTVSFSVVDPESIILDTVGCGVKTFTVDTPGEPVSCWAKSDGGENSASKTIKVDRTPPSASGAADRSPNGQGWYTAPVTISFSGTDAISGIASCTSASYAGPDNGNAVVAGSCSDVAGNVRSVAHAFKYDSTGPTVSNVRAAPGNHSARLSWTASTDTQIAEIARAPGRNNEAETVIYRGKATAFTETGLAVSRRYRFRVSAYDQAMNRTDQSIFVTATGALYGPLPGARVSGAPRLMWAPAKNATYYNLQLIRNGRKILSAWPVRPSYRLRRTWSYQGRRFRLRPGTYRWYVWPGFGKLAAGRYGRQPLGSSTFVVTK